MRKFGERFQNRRARSSRNASCITHESQGPFRARAERWKLKFKVPTLQPSSTSNGRRSTFMPRRVERCFFIFLFLSIPRFHISSFHLFHNFPILRFLRIYPTPFQRMPPKKHIPAISPRTLSIRHRTPSRPRRIRILPTNPH